MSLYPVWKLESTFLIAVLNSNLIFDIYREFINCTVNVQINDLKQLPIKIPNEKQLLKINSLVCSLIQIKKNYRTISDLESCTENICRLENEIDTIVTGLYLI